MGIPVESDSTQTKVNQEVVEDHPFREEVVVVGDLHQAKAVEAEVVAAHLTLVVMAVAVELILPSLVEEEAAVGYLRCWVKEEVEV